MNCCEFCFADDEVIAFIRSNSTQKGDCDFCKNLGQLIIPTAELADMFSELYTSYTPAGFTLFDAELLHEHFIRWKIFSSNLESKVIIDLTKNIGYNYYLPDNKIFTEPTIPAIFADASGIERALTYHLTWELFKKEIKHSNRFFLENSFDLKAFEGILQSYQRSYKKGKTFYRARNSEPEGWHLSKMGQPPQTLATPGRVNPKGISYLYLSNDIQTTLYEVRAAIYDYVTVGEFRLNSDINVVSLRHEARFSPFKLIDRIPEYLLYEGFVQSLHDDLKKPLRRQDSELEYLPTQYLCELIKSLGYDGVEYASSMNPMGFNIALFNSDSIQCRSTDVYEIQSLKYSYEKA